MMPDPTEPPPLSALSDTTLDEDLHRAVSEAIHKGFTHLHAIQRPAGCVVGEVVWCPMLTAQYVMVAHMTGQVIPEERRGRFLKYFEVWQLHDGGWGLHAESPGYVYVTTLVYVALRTMGLSPEHPMCMRGLAWLKAHGGVLHIPSWGKAWLAMYGLYDWRAVPPVPPELWLLPDAAPVHPRRMYCHTRMIYLGLGYLYGVRFQTPVTPLIRSLRAELYDDPFESIDFLKHRFCLAPTDLFEAPSPVLLSAYRLWGVYERIHSRSLRRRALAHCLEHMVAHQRESRYAAISPVNGLMNTLALWHAGHEDFRPSFEGVDYWLWQDDAEGERHNGAHSHSWDTAFALQALCEGPFTTAHMAFLERGVKYLVRSQMTTEVPDRHRYYRDQRLGGWCFSDEHHQWPVSDCTAEAVSALCLAAAHLPEGRLPTPARLTEAARFLLSRQNPDGGWGSYERNRGGWLLTKVNPSEMFGNCMVEHSYIECTASCMQALRHLLGRFGDLFSSRERAEMETRIAKGAALLRRRQEPEGGWPGFWGVNYTYGTLFGITGLLSSGATPDDPAVARACQWLLSHQLPGGGWGESWRGCFEERYIPHDEPQVIMTAWAVMALLRGARRTPQVTEALRRGLTLLVDRQRPDGDWPKEGSGGVFFNTAFHHYMLYKNYFPLWALGLYAAAAR